PSPDIILSPLPPPVRRRTPSHPARLSTASDPCPKSQRTLASMRSCGDLRMSQTPKSASRSVVSAPPTPRSFAPSSPTGSSFRRSHRRTLSFAVPYRSPPASPTLSSPPPPVPPIPEFVLSPTDKKPVLHSPAPTRVNHIYLPEWEQFTVTPDFAQPPGKPAPPYRANQRPNQVVAL
ncbi:hypothetical protein B0H13DRAFT_1962474, partial [Mycena leptocephala]